MKIHYLSDLHLEFGKMPKNYRVPAGTDVVVLAGDIGVGLAGLHWALLAFDCPVVYVAGNHEHYGHLHSASDYMIGKTRVVANCRGYAGDGLCPDFRMNATVEI